MTAHTPTTPAPGAPKSWVSSFADSFSTKGRWLLLSLAVVALDQWTKALVELHLPLHASHPVAPGWLHLTHVRNTGVAFGLLSGRNTSLALALVGLIALGLVVVYFAFTHTRDRWLLAGLSMVMGGAVGNLMDRVVSGAVTDFLDVFAGRYHWPSFNVADSAITVGILLLAFDVLRVRKSSGDDEPELESEQTADLKPDLKPDQKPDQKPDREEAPAS